MKHVDRQRPVRRGIARPYIAAALARQGARIARWLERVETTGPMQVRFHLRFPYPLIRRDMAISVPLRKKGTYDLSRDAQRLPLNGLGPYRLVSFRPGRDIVLERFDGYYADSPKV